VLVALAGCALLVAIAACTSGCAAEAPSAAVQVGQAATDDGDEQDGDAGDVWDDDPTTKMHTVRGGGRAGCATSRQSILASVSGERRAILERAFGWLDDGVAYSQSRQRGGYRTDCSGFVSMAWELSQSFTTASFATGSAENRRLRSYDDLEPGDALVRRSGGSGHIVLFLGWDDDNQGSACVLEQASTAQDMQFRPRGTSSLRSGGYRPVRASSL
jgi:hypothetical protein